MKPILFKGEMVRAILEGRKTQTRRIVKPQPDHITCDEGTECNTDGRCELCEPSFPYGKSGDQLFVKETFSAPLPLDIEKKCFTGFYKATDSDRSVKWRPSIFMPRWASRIHLEITGVRVERLNKITEDDAKAEGIQKLTKDGSVHKYAVLDKGDYSSVAWQDMPRSATEAYLLLWNSINGPGSWDANPWVWVITFRRIKP